jgi:hypothetical protein
MPPLDLTVIGYLASLISNKAKCSTPLHWSACGLFWLDSFRLLTFYPPSSTTRFHLTDVSSYYLSLDLTCLILQLRRRRSDGVLNRSCCSPSHLYLRWDTNHDRPRPITLFSMGAECTGMSPRQNRTALSSNLISIQYWHAI